MEWLHLFQVTFSSACRLNVSYILLTLVSQLINNTYTISVVFEICEQLHEQNNYYY